MLDSAQRVSKRDKLPTTAEHFQTKRRAIAALQPLIHTSKRKLKKECGVIKTT